MPTFYLLVKVCLGYCVSETLLGFFATNSPPSADGGAPLTAPSLCCFCQMEHLPIIMRLNNIKLVVVDSIAALFRSDMGRGRG